MTRVILVACLMAFSLTAWADKHFDRILAQAIEEAHPQGPTTEAKVLAIWRSEMVKFGNGACRCAALIGFTEVNGNLVEKKALCNQGLVEDLAIALMPQLLRLPGNYDLWQDAISKTAVEARATGEAISTRFIAANVKAKEQAEVRRRTGRCITGGEDH
jgi:hypothetical protein